MNRINLLEVYYGFYRDKGKDYASNIIKQVEASSVMIAEFDREVFLEAGRLKATYKFSLADSIVIAQTVLLKGAVLTSDHHEFDAIDGKENFIPSGSNTPPLGAHTLRDTPLLAAGRFIFKWIR